MSERPLRRGNWSVQELERLRQLLPRRGVASTAHLLRRTEDCVRRKAEELLKVPARRGRWTASDDARLQESWGAVEPRLLAIMLGRPSAVVQERADALRADRRSGPWSREEVLRLKELYGTRLDHDLEVCLQRAGDDIGRMAARYCLAKDKRFAASAAGGGTDKVARARQPMPRWSADQIERLRQVYADRDNLEVARLLGRTVASVANKANLLGLRKSATLLADLGRLNVAIRYGGGGNGGGDEPSAPAQQDATAG
ncbi:MAG: hypothetical protein JNN13_01185 [Planctomycetes bacterium]|nr:hypothetical protein [Planctomycetota bacterium]